MGNFEYFREGYCVDNRVLCGYVECGGMWVFGGHVGKLSVGVCGGSVGMWCVGMWSVEMW